MRVALSLPALAALSLIACAPSSIDAGATSSSSHAIINGEQCTAAEFPTAIAILVDATLDFNGFGTQDITTVMCTGTLIAPDVVLTAAHCTDPSLLTGGFGTVTRAEFYVSFDSDLSALAEQGETPAELPASAIPVREAMHHPEFDISTLNGQNVNGPGNFHDVGLMFLDVAIEDVAPERVISAAEVAALSVGDTVSIAGWGQQTVTQDQFTPPPAGTVGKKVCGTTTINELGDFEMQIGADASSVRKCHGDSGGPTYLVIGGERRLIGITSHAYDAEDCNKGGIDTRVDAYLTWIEEEMVSRCDSGVRVACPAPEPEPDDDDEDDEDDLFGCASSPMAPASALSLALFLLRRRKTL